MQHKFLYGILVLISADLSNVVCSTTLPVLLRVWLQIRNPSVECLKARQGELSPAKEWLSSCTRMHLWRLACISINPAGKKRGALGGFGWEWEPALHLDTLQMCWMAPRPHTISPKGKEWRWDRSISVQQSRQEWVPLLQQGNAHIRVLTGHHRDFLNSAAAWRGNFTILGQLFNELSNCFQIRLQDSVNSTKWGQNVNTVLFLTTKLQ